MTAKNTDPNHVENASRRGFLKKGGTAAFLAAILGKGVFEIKRKFDNPIPYQLATLREADDGTLGLVHHTLLAKEDERDTVTATEHTVGELTGALDVHADSNEALLLSTPPSMLASSVYEKKLAAWQEKDEERELKQYEKDAEFQEEQAKIAADAKAAYAKDSIENSKQFLGNWLWKAKKGLLNKTPKPDHAAPRIIYPVEPQPEPVAPFKNNPLHLKGIPKDLFLPLDMVWCADSADKGIAFGQGDNVKKHDDDSNPQLVLRAHTATGTLTVVFEDTRPRQDDGKRQPLATPNIHFFDPNTGRIAYTLPSYTPTDHSKLDLLKIDEVKHALSEMRRNNALQSGKGASAEHLNSMIYETLLKKDPNYQAKIYDKLSKDQKDIGQGRS